MKILHVISALTKGGGERVVVELANRAVIQGHEVTILAAAKAPLELVAFRLNERVELRYVRSDTTSSRHAYPFLPLWLLRNRAWLFKQDVVHCHLTFGSVFGSLLQLMRGGPPKPVVIETYHAVGLPISRWRQAIDAALLSRRDAVAFMADDPYWRAFAAARPHGLFRIIPNGIAPLQPLHRTESERYRAAAGLPKTGLIVGSIGRLVRERRPALLLEVFCALVGHFPKEVHLFLGGEGAERGRLAAEAQQRGLRDRVHLPGLVIDPRKPLALIDLYLTVNVGEITGVAALEAALTGVPIVAVQLQENYRAKADDWIWSSSDPVEVGARAAELLRSRKRRQVLAEKQRAYAAGHFTADGMAQAYQRLYEQAMTRHRRGS